jgi:hypothetical protein
MDECVRPPGACQLTESEYLALVVGKVIYCAPRYNQRRAAREIAAVAGFERVWE